MDDRARHVPDPPLRSLLWRTVGRLAFRWTMFNWFGARRALLRAFGARLTPLTKVLRSVDIDRPWNVRIGARSVVGDHAALRARAPIVIGDRCTVSQLAILATEVRDHRRAGRASCVGPITLGNDAWVATDALVMPDTRIGEGAVIGARSTAIGEIPPWRIAVGDPARPRHDRVIRDLNGATSG